jgi:gamma-glutamylputrescine oxidase
MTLQETWQSPIAPGISWYQATAGERPTYPALDGSTTCDVAIVGGGYTGLQAAYNLAEAGVSVVLIEANRFGDGASGRNGGQLGTGQRSWPEELEEKIGYER